MEVCIIIPQLSLKKSSLLLEIEAAGCYRKRNLASEMKNETGWDVMQVLVRMTSIALNKTFGFQCVTTWTGIDMRPRQKVCACMFTLLPMGGIQLTHRLKSRCLKKRLVCQSSPADLGVRLLTVNSSLCNVRRQFQ